MGKAGRDPQLPVTIAGQRLGDPSAECGRAASNVDGDHECLACDHPDQLPLWVGQLIVEAPDHTGAGAGLIVLYKRCDLANRLAEIDVVPGFEEMTALVFVDLRLDQQEPGNRQILYGQRHHVDCRNLEKDC